MPESIQRVAACDLEVELLTGVGVDDVNRDEIRVLVPEERHGDAVALPMIELAGHYERLVHASDAGIPACSRTGGKPVSSSAASRTGISARIVVPSPRGLSM